MKIGIIGYGSMGKMFLEKFIETNIVEESNLFVSNRTYEKIMDLKNKYPKINICKENTYVAENVDVIFICVKPIEYKEVLSEIINKLKENCLIVSLNGSILLKQLEQICINRKIVRIVPSVTAEVNHSVTLICYNEYVNDTDKNNINILLKCFGTVSEVHEDEISMASDLTSCMPGFIGAIFKVITDEAEKYTKIEKEKIIEMVMETMYGTSKILKEKNITFDNLVDRVATKGGSTEEGTKIIEEKLPEIINEIYEKTLEKRKIISEKVQINF